MYGKITPKLQKPNECHGCPLATVGVGFSHPEGKCTNGVLIVGEALGAQEAIDGLPFRPRGAAGAVLERALRQCGYSREQFGVWNVIACQPPQNELAGTPYELEAARHCRVHFRKVLKQYAPKVILALGNTPLYSLTTYSGKKQSMDWLQGFILTCEEFNLPVIASYHPAYIARGNYNVFPLLCTALKKAVITAKNGVQQLNLNYVTNAGEYELRKLIELCEKEPDTLLCPDLETEGDKDAVLELLTDGDDVDDATGKKKKKVNSKTDTKQLITQVNLAVEPTNSMAFLYTSGTAPLIKRLLEMPNPKVNHNLWYFDTPVLAHNGIEIGGWQDDTLWLFHHIYPDLPGKGSKKGTDDKADGSLANLQFCASLYGFPFPWKHLSDSDPGFYGCADCHSVLKLFWGLYDDAHALGVWDGYVEMVCEMWPILRDAQRRGIPVNREKLTAFRKLMQSKAGEVRGQVQKYIPDELRGTSPKNGYARTPKQTDGLVQRDFVVQGGISRCKCNKIRKKRLDYWMAVEYAEWEGPEDNQKLRAPDPTCEVCAGHGWIETTDGVVTRWCKLQEFNVTSPVQLKLYAGYKRHEIPKNSKKKYAMDAETLDKLIRKHNDPVYKWTKELREYVKMDTTYGAGWMPDADGCVHPQFGFLPATGQLNSVGPNAQNCCSADTEVLTSEGWLLFPDAVHKVQQLNSTLTVAQYDIDHLTIEFVRPDVVVVSESNRMLNIKTEQQIDLLVTPDHECLLRQRRRGNDWVKVPAQDYLQDALQYQAGTYVGGNVTLRWSQIALICALQADGHVERRHGAYQWSLKKTRKIERITRALREENIAYTCHPKKRKGFWSFRISFNHIPEWYKDKKFFDSWILDLDRESLDLMQDELWHWDGCFSRRTMYSSSQKINADWAQIICILSGRRAKIREYWNGNPRSSINYQVDAVGYAYSATANHVSIPINGKVPVYCFTMPLGTLIVRRNGLVAITGNCPNISKKGEIAVAFNSAIECPPGYTFLSLDYKSFHSQTLGVEAGDMQFIRLAKIDAHSYLALNMLKLPDHEKCIEWPDDELRKFLKWHRKNYTLKNGDAFDKYRNSKAKPGGLSWGFGIGARKLYLLNEESFDSEKEVQYMLDVLDARFPIAAEFRRTVPLRAERNGHKLVNTKFGCVRWFYDIRRYNPKRGEWDHGGDWEKAIAYLPANTAFCHKKQALKRLYDMRACDRYGFCNDIHDALKFCCPDRFVEEALHVVKQEMQFVSDRVIMPNGEGFYCEVEAEMGKTWATMEEVH